MSKPNRHNVAGVPPFNQKEFDATFRTKLCPELTAGMIKAKSESKIALPPGALPAAPALEAMPCQGHDCMFFRVIADEHGIPRSGACSQAMAPMAMNQIAGILNAINNQLHELIVRSIQPPPPEPPPVQ